MSSKQKKRIPYGGPPKPVVAATDPKTVAIKTAAIDPKTVAKTDPKTVVAKTDPKTVVAKTAAKTAAATAATDPKTVVAKTAATTVVATIDPATAITDPAPIPTTKSTSLTDPPPSTTASVPTSSDPIEPTEGEGVTEVKVYGNKRMFVETDFDEKTFKLKPGQELLAKNLRLQRYAKKQKKEPKWIVDILKEIVIQKCRDDPQIMLTQPCINFRAYLEDLMIDLFKTGKYDIDDDEKWELKMDRDKREKEEKKAKKAKKGAAAAATAAATEAKDPTKVLGNTRLLIKIPFSAFKERTVQEIYDEYYNYTLPRLEQLFPPIGGLPTSIVVDNFKKQYREGQIIY